MRFLLLATALARKTTREEQHAIASLPTVSGNPLVSLEHINLSSGDKWSQRIDAFYFDVLRCARDPRSPAVLARTNSARAKQNRPGVANQSWANIGFQQFHLLFGDGLDEEMQQPPQQRLRGEIVLAWPRHQMKGLYARLAEWGAAFTGIGTFEGPFGNRFRLVAADEVLACLKNDSLTDPERLGCWRSCWTLKGVGAAYPRFGNGFLQVSPGAPGLRRPDSAASRAPGHEAGRCVPRCGFRQSS